MTDVTRYNEAELKDEIKVQEGLLDDDARAYKENRAKRIAYLGECAEALVEIRALRNAKARCMRLVKAGAGFIDLDSSYAVWIDPPFLPDGADLYSNEEDDPYHDNHFTESVQDQSAAWLEAESRLKEYQAALLKATK